MFDINVVAPEFKGLNTVKQHRIINEVGNGDSLMTEREVREILRHNQFVSLMVSGSQGGD